MLGVLAVALVVVAGILVRLRPSELACPPSATVVLVDSSRRTLALCDGGRPVERFTVRLGSGGTGKRASGDKKTPLGTYALGAPRPSASYGTFVPIGYPTEAQRLEGLTGGAIGVHGPDRRVRTLGPLLNLLDTTDGCVGLATDAEMGRVRAWVDAHRPRTIELR